MCADDTAPARVWESRSLPLPFHASPYRSQHTKSELGLKSALFCCLWIAFPRLGGRARGEARGIAVNPLRSDNTQHQYENNTSHKLSSFVEPASPLRPPVALPQFESWSRPAPTADACSPRVPAPPSTSATRSRGSARHHKRPQNQRLFGSLRPALSAMSLVS